MSSVSGWEKKSSSFESYLVTCALCILIEQRILDIGELDLSDWCWDGEMWVLLGWVGTLVGKLEQELECTCWLWLLKLLSEGNILKQNWKSAIVRPDSLQTPYIEWLATENWMILLKSTQNSFGPHLKSGNSLLETSVCSRFCVLWLWFLYFEKGGFSLQGWGSSRSASCLLFQEDHRKKIHIEKRHIPS